MPQESIVCIPDISDQVTDDDKVSIDFLLPNGVFLNLLVDFNRPLDLLKQTVWESAKKYPLFSKLKGKDCYFFEYLNRGGEKEEANDESLRLSEIRPMARYMRLLERQDEGETKTIDRQITNLLGNKSVMEMDAVPRAEVDDFRKKMSHFTQSITPARPDFQTMFQKKYPPQLRKSDRIDTIPASVRDKLEQDFIQVEIYIKESKQKFWVGCHIDSSAEVLVDKAMGKRYGQAVRHTYDYILKVVGQEDYIYGKTPLHQFKYVYSCLLAGRAPNFWLVNKKTVLQFENFKQKSLPNPPPTQTNHQDVRVWDIHDNFKIKIPSIQNIEVASDYTRDNIDKVKLFVGLYHGNEVLCDVNCTSEQQVVGGHCVMNGDLTFDMKVQDVQMDSRLCFTLHGRMRGAKGLNPIAWVNIPVFDFRSRLLVGEHKLAMWPVTEDLRLEETGCHPLGTVAINPHASIMLTVVFSDYNRNPPIVFPPDDVINQVAANNMECSGLPGSPNWKPPKPFYDQLRGLLRTGQWQWEGLHEQDKEKVWLMRYECREFFPQALPLVLKSVKWNHHIDVAKMQLLLTTWKQKIPVDSALELLDFNFPDRNVRKYAVDCLQDLSDDDLSLYLLQLVQALKYENYLYCPLAVFLMERALRNQHIGHLLFWLLKSELHNVTVTVRYGLLMEAYLKSAPDHLSILYREFEALNKLHAVSMHVKNERFSDKKTRDEAKANLQMILDQPAYDDKLSNLISPLSPLYKLQKILVKKCKCMDSKKRPLYLVWSNDDDEGQEIHIIYKNGDDLRQDMLTLQMLKVMDNIWQCEGLDLRMNVYGCVATGLEQGMIEVVRHSETIASIQRKKPLDKKVLYDWLKEKCKNDRNLLNSAVEEFILSCAGYTVATYVLGIGDRHNDNIMLKESGQLFHIDFGHFLGNFKSKFGFKRERVPFVLTSHFAYVITDGDKNAKNYERFQKYCVEAYLALRKNAQLLIRLFMMMMSSGIPQLSSISDLDYVKETLALKLDEKEAVKQFKSKMTEALKSVSTHINWFIHNKMH